MTPVVCTEVPDCCGPIQKSTEKPTVGETRAPTTVASCSYSCGLTVSSRLCQSRVGMGRGVCESGGGGGGDGATWGCRKESDNDEMRFPPPILRSGFGLVFFSPSLPFPRLYCLTFCLLANVAICWFHSSVFIFRH